MEYFKISQLSDTYTNPEKQFLKKVLTEELENFSLGEREDIATTWLDKLNRGEPYQYVVGKTWFYNLPIRVNKNVLIPRPETEELVDLIVKDSKSKFPKYILDMGTGSGCIALALKQNIPTADVFGIDKSEEALVVANQNSLQLNLNVNFSNQDILDIEMGVAENIPFDIIVSNPPYIGKEEVLSHQVLEYEPSMALFADKDVLIFYKAIVNFAKKQLSYSGKIYVEINQRYGEETRVVFTNAGFTATLIKDISGNDRFIMAQRIQ